MKDIRCLNINVIKIIALITMLIDHIGLFFFSNIIIFRIIGRISFPLFAYALFEGARYTKNKIIHFSLIFTLATIIQLIYYLYSKSLDMSILITFSLSLILIYSIDYVRNCFILNKEFIEKISAILLLISIIIGIIFLSNIVNISYGIIGIFIPAILSLTKLDYINIDYKIKKYIDNNIFRAIILAILLLLLAINRPMNINNINIEFFLLLAIPFIILYNGKKGKYNIKYLFYIFYPLHLAILEFINLLINIK